jgi:tetraacyldisaccharide 4'-kinase
VVRPGDDPALVGDEPLRWRMRVCRSGRPRSLRCGARSLIATDRECDVLLSDDGLQHCALSRDFEIAVIDAARASGTDTCFPPGRCASRLRRLREVDAVVTLVSATVRQPGAAAARERDVLRAASLAQPHASGRRGGSGNDGGRVR